MGHRYKPFYLFLHQNCLLLVSPEDIQQDIQDTAQPSVEITMVSNVTLRAFLVGMDSLESDRQKPSLVTQQGCDKTQWVWLNGEFQTWPGALNKPKATPDSQERVVSEPEAEIPD